MDMETNTVPPTAWAFRALGRLLPPRRRLQALAFELAAVEARERERLADGLHDDVGQLLALVRFKLGQLAASSEPGGGDPVLQELRALLGEAAEATRRATFELRSPVLQQLGLQAAFESLAERMQRLGGLQIELRGVLPGPALPPAVQSVVFRVVRELLLNVHKHAQARQAVVTQGRTGDRLRIEVHDDGVGFARGSGPWRFSAEGGYGLHSAEAQIAAMGGGLTVTSRLGQGTQAQLWLPARAGLAKERRRSRALDAA